MTGVVACSIREAHVVGTSRRYQVSGQAASPATVTTFCPAGTRAFACSTARSARTRSSDVCTYASISACPGTFSTSCAP